MKKLLFAFAVLAGMAAGVMVLSSFTKQNTKNVVECVNDDDDGVYVDTKTAYGYLCSDKVPGHITVDIYRRGPYNYYAIIQEEGNGRKRDIEKVQENGSGRNAVVSWQDCYYWFRINWK